MSIISTTQYEELSIRVSPGKFVNFPVIDNKGIFKFHKPSKGDAGFLLESIWMEDKNHYGIYKCVDGLAFLTAAFSSDEIITKSAALIILKSFPYLFTELKANIKEIFPDLKISFHIGIEEPYYNTLYVSVENEFIRLTEIKDPRNLSKKELYFLNEIPGLADKIQQIYK